MEWLTSSPTVSRGLDTTGHNALTNVYKYMSCTVFYWLEAVALIVVTAI